MSRTVPEWIATHDDQATPKRVRIRVFERHNGICHISKRKIMPGDKWECDHIIALINGGEHRESNLAPALAAPHKEKTKADTDLKKKIARTKAKHLGQHKSAYRPLAGTRRSGWKKPFNGPAERRR